MIKFFTNVKAVFSALILTAVMATSTVSCSYDDTDLRQQIQDLRQELAALRDAVREELNSLKELLDGNLMISDIERQSDGSTLLVLSDGTRIKVPVEGAGVPDQIQYPPHFQCLPCGYFPAHRQTLFCLSLIPGEHIKHLPL